MTVAQLADAIPIILIAISAMGALGALVNYIGVQNHNARVQTLGTGIESIAAQIHKAVLALDPAADQVDVNAFTQAKVSQGVQILLDRNKTLVAKIGWSPQLIAEHIDSAVHTLDVSSGSSLTASVVADVATAKNAAQTAVATVTALGRVAAPSPTALKPATTATGQVAPPPSGRT